MAAGGQLPAYAVIYDGSCNVCAALVSRLDRWDRENILEIIPSHAAAVRERFAWITDAAFAESVQVVRIHDGVTWQGGAAIEQLLDVLPRGRWVGWVFSIPFARGLAERFYRWFARNRHQMGCGAHCAAHPPAPSQ